MLDLSFRVFSGISLRKERELWKNGVCSWDKYELGISPQRSLLEVDPTYDSPVAQELRACRSALASADVEFFAKRLERSEHYRIAASFPRDCIFLDIETTGLSRYYDQITVIGWYLDGEYGLYVKGNSEREFRSALARAKCVVTFNGTLFDLPFIREQLPAIAFPGIHVDLRYLCRRVGLVGGQKAIETQLGLHRLKGIEGVSGEYAPVLWHRYTNGDLGSLKTLLEYNIADIEGLINIFCRVAMDAARSAGAPVTETSSQKIKQALPLRTPSYNEALKKCLIPFPSSNARSLRIEQIIHVDHPPILRVVGIDLTGSEARASGWCLLDGHRATTERLHTDDEIVSLTQRAFPHVVSIDSPLNLPEGRITVDDSDPGRRIYGIMRHCERVLKRRGVNVYPALLPSMQKLTARGIRLASRLRKLGLPVIESYPGAAQDIMRIPRKRKGLEYLEEGLAAFGISGSFVQGGVSHDELDAITSAAVGIFFWSSMIERLGPDPLGEEALIIPDLRSDLASARSRLVIGLSGALGAGKTTAAKYLESIGFHYCRYSEVIERLVSAKKSHYSRADLQSEGQRVHNTLGQRWLGRELIRPHLDRRLLVVDGLRFPDDHAFLTEVFSSQFLHINLLAPRQLRRRRFGGREGGLATFFDEQERHTIEGMYDNMKSLARDVIENRSSKAALFDSLNRILRRDWKD